MWLSHGGVYVLQGFLQPLDDCVGKGFHDRERFSCRNIEDIYGNPISGTVELKVNSAKYNVTVTDRKGSRSISGLAKGTYTVSASYGGDSSYEKSNASTSFSVIDKSKITASNLVMDYYDGSYFKVTVYGRDGKKVGAGTVVSIKINGKTSKVKTNAKGIAQLKITNIPKKYTVTASCFGKTIKKTVTVKQILKSTKTVSVKKSAKKLVLKATLKTSKGKAIKSKQISFKFNGKTYKAKTNAKGIAQVTIKQSVIKKLKAGKKYTVQITYVKDTIKTTVAVKK